MQPFHSADILWSSAFDPAVLRIAVERASPGDPSAVDLPARFDRAVILLSREGEHVALGTPGYPLRLDVVAGTILNGPVVIRPLLDCPESPARLETLARLMSHMGVKGIARWRLRPDARMAKLAEALRAIDARDCGASLREIASVLLGESRSKDWPGSNGSLQSLVRRRIALGDKLLHAGPVHILGRRI